MGTPADDATTLTASCCFLEPDSLVKALCEGAGPPAWVISVDPMLDELPASLVASRPAATPLPQEVQASLVDTRPPVMTPQCTTDSPSLSLLQGTPPQKGQPVVAGAEAPREDGEVWPPGFERPSTWWGPLRRHRTAFRKAKQHLTLPR
jgi:hypothetical protein